jgi:segregation and condensation protein B
VTFGTTPAFLDHFGLASTRDLPGLADLKAAGLLDRYEPGTSTASAAAGREEIEHDPADLVGADLDELPEPPPGP